jgi:hypothetical protein
MLNGLILENFKAFGGRRVIPIRPLTLIFGPNSAGKSAILQALLLLKQTLDDPDIGNVPLRLTGSLVDLGSFRDMVFRQETDRVCEITPLFQSADTNANGIGIRVRQHYGVRAFSPVSTMIMDSMPIYIDDPAEPAALVLPGLNYLRDFGREEDKLQTSIPVKANRLEDYFAQIGRYGIISDYDIRDSLQEERERFANYTYEQFLGELDDSLPRSAIIQNFPLLIRDTTPSQEWPPSVIDEWDQLLSGFLRDEIGIIEMPNLTALGLEMSNNLRNALQRLVYVGPIREVPERHYLFGGAVPANVGGTGQFAADILFNRPDLLERLNQSFAAFDIGYRLNVRRFREEGGAESRVFALGLIDKRTNVQVTLRDVGFGVSQVLPVLVQSLLAENQVIMMEQPELHLHPRLQAELGDLFTRSALGDRRNTFLLETHSEHLILRIMRRMRDTSRGTLPEGIPPVRPEDVSVIFVQPTPEGSIPLVMDLDEEGQLLTAWPNGFFEEGFHERFA